MSCDRFRVGADPAHRLYFVRDTVTGRCKGFYASPTQAFAVARKHNRAIGGGA